MNLPNFENATITHINDGVLLFHQNNPLEDYSCCDGLIVLPKDSRNRNPIAIDVNVEPVLIRQIIDEFGPVKNYICTHGEMDHIAHLYVWEDSGAEVYAPFPESNYLTDLNQFYLGFGFNDVMEYSSIQRFARMNGYHECKWVRAFKPGDRLKIENLEMETMLYKGHSRASVGVLLEKEKILHIGNLGFDRSSPGADGTGPFYGYRQCSLNRYYRDIDNARSVYTDRANFMTASHGYLVEKPDMSPFDYMEEKIRQNQQKVDSAFKRIDPLPHSKEETFIELLKLDLFYPKKKAYSFMVDIYTLWDYWMIRHHMADVLF